MGLFCEAMLDVVSQGIVLVGRWFRAMDTTPRLLK